MIKTIREWRGFESAFNSVGSMFIGMAAGLMIEELQAQKGEQCIGMAICAVAGMFFLLWSMHIDVAIKKHQKLACEYNLFCENEEVQIDFRIGKKR